MDKVEAPNDKVGAQMRRQTGTPTVRLRRLAAELRDVGTAAVSQLSGGPAADLLDLARELDTALDSLRLSTNPLTYAITPLRVRRRTVRYLVALLETCAYHARSLAATAEEAQ